MLIKYFVIFFITLLNVNILSDDDLNKELALPELGDRVSGAVSSAQERAIGNIVLEQIYSQAPLISDPLLFDYTEHLIYRLSEYSQVKDRYFKVLLIDDKSLNAFAAPGGIIGVNGGLFLHADNEGQFSSVLAHELAHAVDDCKSGHGKGFRKICLAVGLDGESQMRYAKAGDMLAEKIRAIIEKIGEYPHDKMNISDRNKQTTRNIKVECSECGFGWRASRSMIERMDNYTCNGCGNDTLTIAV